MSTRRALSDITAKADSDANAGIDNSPRELFLPPNSENAIVLDNIPDDQIADVISPSLTAEERILDSPQNLSEDEYRRIVTSGGFYAMSVDDSDTDSIISTHPDNMTYILASAEEADEEPDSFDEGEEEDLDISSPEETSRRRPKRRMLDTDSEEEEEAAIKSPKTGDHHADPESWCWGCINEIDSPLAHFNCAYYLL